MEHLSLLVTLTLLLGLTYAATRLWGRYALSRIEYRRRFDRQRCFAGETVGLDVELINRKILPVTYLTVDDAIPTELEVHARRLSFLRIGKGSLRLVFRLGWYQKVIRHYKVTAARRGYYRLGPALIRGGDPLGYVTVTESLPAEERLLVYPRILPLEQVGLPSQRPFGDLRSRDRLFEDPMRFAGVRDYRPGDPLNRIHWKASAAAGHLQVRLLDPSASGGLAIFLNTWSYETPWMGVDQTAFEGGCVVAASLVNWAIGESIPVGLYANGLTEGWGMNLRLPVGRGPDVLQSALEGLARLSTTSNHSLSELMADEVSRLSYGTTLAVITRQVDESLAATLLEVRRSGRPVALILTAGDEAGQEPSTLPRLPGVMIYQVPNGMEVSPHALA